MMAGDGSGGSRDGACASSRLGGAAGLIREGDPILSDGEGSTQPEDRHVDLTHERAIDPFIFDGIQALT